jgi:hypothetical protein
MRKALTLTSEVAAGLMVIAAANLAMIYVLLSARHHVGPPSTDLVSNLPIVAIGGFPFLATAALITWTVLSARATPGALDRLITITVIALPVLVASAFWSGLVTSMYVPPDGSPPANALYVYQFTFLAAVGADLTVLVLAIVTYLRKAPHGHR